MKALLVVGCTPPRPGTNIGLRRGPPRSPRLMMVGIRMCWAAVVARRTVGCNAVVGLDLPSRWSRWRGRRLGTIPWRSPPWTTWWRRRWRRWSRCSAAFPLQLLVGLPDLLEFLSGVFAVAISVTIWMILQRTLPECSLDLTVACALLQTQYLERIGNGCAHGRRRAP